MNLRLGHVLALFGVVLAASAVPATAAATPSVEGVVHGVTGGDALEWDVLPGDYWLHVARGNASAVRVIVDGLTRGTEEVVLDGATASHGTRLEVAPGDAPVARVTEGSGRVVLARPDLTDAPFGGNATRATAHAAFALDPGACRAFHYPVNAFAGKLPVAGPVQLTGVGDDVTFTWLGSDLLPREEGRGVLVSALDPERGDDWMRVAQACHDADGDDALYAGIGAWYEAPPPDADDGFRVAGPPVLLVLVLFTGAAVACSRRP